jgi:hypothetical protein
MGFLASEIHAPSESAALPTGSVPGLRVARMEPTMVGKSRFAGLESVLPKQIAFESLAICR